MTQDMKKDMILHTMTKKLVCNLRTPVRLGACSSSFKGVLRTMLLLLMMALGFGEMWGQTDYSGTYFLSGNNRGQDSYNIANTTTNYYLCPTVGWIYYDANATNLFTNVDNGQPFITTFQYRDGVKDASEAVWRFVKQGNYYNIIHNKTNKYLVCNGQITTSAINRIRVHLEGTAPTEPTQTAPTESTQDNHLFTITYNNSGYFNISPKYQYNKEGTKYLNTTEGNQNSLQGVSTTKNDGPTGAPTAPQGTTGYNCIGGTIGLWTSGADNTSKWYIELFTPEISVDNCTFTLSYPIEDNTVEIRYTTDGTAPTASSTLYTEPFTPGLDAVQIKVTAFKTGISAIKSPTAIYGFSKLPALTYELNQAESKLSLNASVVNGIIYYKTGGETPTISNENEYTGPFPVTEGTIVKAFVAKQCYTPSDIITHEVTKVATPTFELENNKVKIASETPDVTIYYSVGDNIETLEAPNTLYTSPLTVETGKYFKAIAMKNGCFNSDVATTSEAIKLKCAKPSIKRMGKKLSVSCSFPPSGSTIKYTIADNGGTPADPNSSSSTYTGPIDVSEKTPPITIKAYVSAEGYTDSDNSAFTLSSWGNGTEADPFVISTQEEFNTFVNNVNTNSNNEAEKYYQLIVDVNGGSAITTPFAGGLIGVADDEDGSLPTISGLNHALFNTIDGGTVKNIILDNVSISSGTAFTVSGDGKTAIGAIACVAKGTTRIYNCGILATNSTVKTNDDGYTEILSCGSSVGGTADYVGGLVGFLDDEARVINCYSYADITNGTSVGGIVGYNNVATASNNLKTMVMNCMFYGNITGGTDKAPIYNGTEIINKDDTGVGNYNYFLADATFTDGINTYNCALMAEKRFLQRFEFFRHLLNGHLELAGWWATGTFSKADMAKWVMEPSKIGTSTPYPILKAQGKYPSVVNLDKDNLKEFSTDEEIKKTQRNQGRKFDNLAVTIQMDNVEDESVPYHHPGTGENEARITTSSLSLPILDKDPDHFNFNYYKVQLPYYNDVGTKNYTGYRVVTGWKIVSISGGTTSFTTGDDASTNALGVITSAPYNFADRNCTEKDLYSLSGRVFNQGAYFDVPEGVTSITIQPYWAKCAYLADPNADEVYNQDMDTQYDVPNVGGGTKYINGNSYPIAEDNQVVFTTMGNAIASSGTGMALFQGVSGAGSHTVYDYAVVLVGNYHFYGDLSADKSKPYTVTSIDLDGDNEPDYSYILRFDGRMGLHPVRVDFLNVPGLGMAQKSTESSGSYNFGIMQPLYWFEVTNTALFRVTQMEYEHKDRAAKPLILHGGVIEQWVSAQSGGNGQLTTYIHVGSNVWFKEFHLGCHQDKSDIATKHPPVSVTGGDYDEFYLTGLYATTTNCNDNAECYINGGRFDKVAGAGTEGIGDASAHANGNIVWQIQNADIEEFYGGGINASKPIEGSITTVITDSHVKRFCGGPKFGDMNPGKTVITTAKNCTFGSFFGAGYGGNSYNRAAPGNFTGSYDYEWNKWVAGTKKGNVGGGNYSNGVTYEGYKQNYISAFGGVSTRFDYQFLPQSDNEKNVGRLFIDFVNFSLATTRNVTSTLTGCTITGNFYGGGSLGKVDGNVTSTLTNCTVRGSVFGGGYDATRPTVQVMNTSNTGSIDGFLTPPKYDTNTGAFIPAAEPYNTSTEYTWEHRATVNSTETAIDKENHILYTTADLNTLGQVTGNVELNILGNTLVEGQALDYEGNPTGGDRGGVFGGGDASAVVGNTTVTINATALQDGAAYNAYCVYGGGNSAPVGGNSTVILKGNTQVLDNVFGGGNEGEVGGSATVNITQ